MRTPPALHTKSETPSPDRCNVRPVATISLRLKDPESKQLKAAAEAAGMTLSQWLRQRLGLPTGPKARRPLPVGPQRGEVACGPSVEVPPPDTGPGPPKPLPSAAQLAGRAGVTIALASRWIVQAGGDREALRRVSGLADL